MSARPAQTPAPAAHPPTRLDAARQAEVLRRVRQVEVRTRRLVTEALAGAYHSAFKGQGLNFEEVREYAPGDDVRALDWNVSARMDRPFIKLFREERELTFLLAVDLSASGDFGSGAATKREQLAEIAAVLAFSALRNQDKVGLLLFTDGPELYLAPRKGRGHILRVIREVLFFAPRERGTALPAALDHVNQVLKRRAIVFLLSDFLEPAHRLPKVAPALATARTPLERALALGHRRHDLVAVSVTDPRERALPDVGWIVLEDAETGEQLELNTADRRLRERYAAAQEEREKARERLFRQTGVDHFAVTVGQPWIPALRQFFARREARR